MRTPDQTTNETFVIRLQKDKQQDAFGESSLHTISNWDKGASDKFSSSSSSSSVVRAETEDVSDGNSRTGVLRI